MPSRASALAPPPDGRQGAAARLPKMWSWLSIAAALLAMAGSVVGLLAADSIYGDETHALADAVTAQDFVNLVLVAPLMLVFALRASDGSLRSWLCLLGCLSFTPPTTTPSTRSRSTLVHSSSSGSVS